MRGRLIVSAGDLGGSYIDLAELLGLVGEVRSGVRP